MSKHIYLNWYMRYNGNDLNISFIQNICMQDLHQLSYFQSNKNAVKAKKLSIVQNKHKKEWALADIF